MEYKRVTKRIILGSVALALWMIVFSGGLLMETSAYRRHLAPQSFAKQDAMEKTKALLSLQNGNSATNFNNNADTKAPEVYQGSSVRAFLSAALWYTPTNLAFLALLAGLLGGCASNVLVEELGSEPSKHASSASARYLNESPYTAMIRSFIVYLCICAGLFFVMDDPFKDPTPSQYMRLAGTISVLGLLVGYDPSRISAWIGLVPNPTSQGATLTETHHVEKKMTTQQGDDQSTTEIHQTTTTAIAIENPINDQVPENAGDDHEALEPEDKETEVAVNSNGNKATMTKAKPRAK